MKKNIFYSVILLTFFGLMMSCDPKEEELEQKISEINVILPDDLEIIELDYENPSKALDVEWQTEEGVSYEFVVSLNENMSNPSTIALSATGTDVLTHQQLDSIMADLGVGIYKKAELYWVIKGSKGKNSSTSSSRIMELWRFLNPFVDQRDGEIYRVCKVVDQLSGNYWIWMADNMRCKKYSDGTPLDLVNDVRFNPSLPSDSEHQKEWDRLRGGYYTWNAAVRNVTAAENGEKVQGIAPNGWHIATKQEWIDLLNLQEDNNQPGTFLKDGNYWAANSSNFGTNTSKFNMVSTGYIGNPIGRDNYNVVEEETTTLFWSSTVPVEGDEIPWSPPAANFPNQAYTRAFRANDPGAALYVYDRLRGYSVRCVLD